MKNYSALWQKKRSQLRVDGDPHSDWLQMRSVLDHQMPSSGLIKKPYNPGGLKWIYKVFIGISTAVSIYGLAHVYLAKNQHDQSRNISVKENPVETHSVVTRSRPLAPVDSHDRGRVSKATPLDIATSIPSQPHSGNNKAANVRTSSATIADSLNARPKYAGYNSQRRDSVLLINASPRVPVPDSVTAVNKTLSPIVLNGKAGQKALSDSLRKLKKKKRSKIGVFL